AWEVGARMRFLDDAATLNVTLFRQDVTDFQVLTLPPNSVATTVVNAGEARSQGLELDALWLPASWLTIGGALAFNDSEFLSFVFGQCSFDRPDTDGNGDGRCDVTGQPLFRTPKWKSTLVGNARTPAQSIVGLRSVALLDGVDLLGGLTFEYQDVQYLERTFDPRVRQAPFFRFGTNLGFASSRHGWSARVVVENLTDEPTSVLIRDVPLGGGNFAKIPEPQRLVFASVRWEF
ncbi:MAG: TonB-dependent receptor domain-containing protein, partial [Candidatus Binatia bacterium]